MRIAILDDSAAERKELHRRLRLQLEQLARHADILEYDNGESFLTAARQKRFTLAFLDIYMNNENGVEIARRLRTFDTDCFLVFTTCSTDHALDGFRVWALQYLVKPYTEDHLLTVLQEVINRLPVSDSFIDINLIGGTVRLRFQEILYAEHFQHQIHIYTTDGKELCFRQTFREFTNSLNDDRFFLCSRGVLVNLEHAKDFDGRDFILTNGTRVSVTRNLSKDARLAFGDFLFKRRR